MILRKKLFTFFLWWAVIGFSLWVGGTLFNMLVIVPIWSESPPETVRHFFGDTSFSKFINNFFGPPWIVLRFVPLIAALFLGWGSRLHKRYLLITTVIFIFGVVYTLGYIYTINDILIFSAGGDKTAEEIRIMVDKWIFADKLRFATMLIGYFFLLKAFRLPFPVEKIKE